MKGGGRQPGAVRAEAPTRAGGAQHALGVDEAAEDHDGDAHAVVGRLKQWSDRNLKDCHEHKQEPPRVEHQHPREELRLEGGNVRAHGMRQPQEAREERGRDGSRDQEAAHLAGRHGRSHERSLQGHQPKDADQVHGVAPRHPAAEGRGQDAAESDGDCPSGEPLQELLRQTAEECGGRSRQQELGAQEAADLAREARADAPQRVLHELARGGEPGRGLHPLRLLLRLCDCNACEATESEAAGEVQQLYIKPAHGPVI
mmetsp:Transcript_66476/g.205799  ORF Transcript_66476/g.205799 Transcript_66476/m.205799 type:complete len:258 (-) Transcript_66476:17-790(-)